MLFHHLEEILTLLFILCQFQVKLFHQCDASPGQVVGDTQMCHIPGGGDITLVFGVIPTRPRPVDDGLLSTDPASCCDDQGMSPPPEMWHICVSPTTWPSEASRSALMEQFNLKLTQDEQQRQYLLQVVEKKHRQRHPDATKPVMTG